ncbi:hypothetical protein F0562_029274 [Nyssa sinensis]|uniref:GRPD C-terminal domain-containing protein n=1 Tax=Nyssa sinensis TaxID=561372 RepID=A0A5J5B3L9_9ASTE|nr:hypothetical protein F0562_029274 [Nyssa sinensis]
MSTIRNGDGVLDGMSTRSLSGITEEATVRLSVDLVSAAGRHVGFLRLVADSHWLHQRPTVVEAIRRYDELWMPLISDLTVGSTPPILVPPIDVEWVWYCHTLNPVSYRRYCESRFSKLIGKPAIFDEENEEYAWNRCREIWIRRYPSEQFENEFDSDEVRDADAITNEDLLGEVLKQKTLCTLFSEPYMSEIVYLIAARQRYKGFLYNLQRFADECPRLVPTSDILLMLLTHQSYPTVYAADVTEMERDMGKVVGLAEAVKEEQVEETKKLWERTFDQPYEKAGGAAIGRLVWVKPPVYWEVTNADVNVKYRSMAPRFLLEVCVFMKLNSKMKAMGEDISRDFLRLQMVRCHRELKIDTPIFNFSLDSWRKGWHAYCEFGTRGVVIELRHRGGHCFKGSSLRDTETFLWNDLLRAPSLTLGREVDQNIRFVTSITPPVQASYLLKCVPDRVTDDSGAMISDVILRLNQYRPQEGRWLSRTVLDHAGRACFIVRMRVGGGFWRRGGETPSAVKWEDRVVEIREGSWSYVAGSIGRAPDNVVGTATPKKPSEHWNASWCFSTGDELMLRWDSSTSISSLSFYLENQTSPDSTMKLLKGRKMQYKVKKFHSKAKDEKENTNNEEVDEEEGEGEDEEGFVMLVRISEENPTGKATALLNWKLLVVEFLPEEDAVLMLLLCISILRSISEMRKEDVGSLLIRRRLMEEKLGARDWGSVILHPSSCSPSIFSPHLQPWYWNAKAVMASKGVDIPRQPALNYSQAEGGDKLYKRGIIS